MKIMVCVYVVLISLGTAGASEKLEVIYPEKEFKDEAVYPSPYFIDNQSYLRERNERRSGTSAAPATMIFIDNSSCVRSGCSNWGVEYFDGSTFLRYYQGYPVNRRHYHTGRPGYRPPPAPYPRRRPSRVSGHPGTQPLTGYSP